MSLLVLLLFCFFASVNYDVGYHFMVYGSEGEEEEEEIRMH